MLNAHAVSHPQEFQASGAFTFKQRLVESLKANLKFYAIILATGLVIVIWMAIYNNLGPSALSATMVAAANTYGMLLIVVMLGYGLVEVPRIMWNNTNAASALKRLEYMFVTCAGRATGASCANRTCAGAAIQGSGARGAAL